MSPSEFWRLTPNEFYYISKHHSNHLSDSYQTSWEQTRLLVYYIFCSYPKKNKNPNFNRFKTDFMPLPWDKDFKVKDTEFFDPEKVVSLDDWKDRLSKLSGATTKVNPEDIAKMNI